MFCNQCHNSRYQLDGSGRECEYCQGVEISCCEGSAVCVTGELEPGEDVEVAAERDSFAELYIDYGAGDA